MVNVTLIRGNGYTPKCLKHFPWGQHAEFETRIVDMCNNCPHLVPPNFEPYFYYQSFDCNLHRIKAPKGTVWTCNDGNTYPEFPINLKGINCTLGIPWICPTSVKYADLSKKHSRQ